MHSNVNSLTLCNRARAHTHTHTHTHTQKSERKSDKKRDTKSGRGRRREEAKRHSKPSHTSTHLYTDVWGHEQLSVNVPARGGVLVLAPQRELAHLVHFDETEVQMVLCDNEHCDG